MIQFVLVWPIVLIFTAILYFLMLVTLPFSATWATIFLFTLIGYWSRLPGVGLPTAGILYVADFIDILSMIIAINVGGLTGAFVSLFANLGGRLSGAFTTWEGNVVDAFGMFITCLIIPYVHAATQDVFMTMVWFMVIRLAIVLPLGLAVVFSMSLSRFFLRVTAPLIALFFINIFYTKLFGNFLDGLMEQGATFNWALFMLATVIIIVGGVYMRVKSKKITMSSALKNIKEIGKKPDFKHVYHGKVKKEDFEKDVQKIRKGCPLCKSHIKGKHSIGFYCKVCNLLFSEKKLKGKEK